MHNRLSTLKNIPLAWGGSMVKLDLVLALICSQQPKLLPKFGVFEPANLWGKISPMKLQMVKRFPSFPLPLPPLMSFPLLCVSGFLVQTLKLTLYTLSEFRLADEPLFYETSSGFLPLHTLSLPPHDWFYNLPTTASFSPFIWKLVPTMPFG